MPITVMPLPGSLMSTTDETAKRRMQDWSSGLSNHSCTARSELAFRVSESGVNPDSRSLGKSSACRFATSGSACSSTGRNSVSVVTRINSSLSARDQSRRQVSASLSEKRAISRAVRS